jgi:hypothetical protein
MITLFGWQFRGVTDSVPEPPSFSPRDHDDGAAVVAAAGMFRTFIDLDGSVRSESELVTRCRLMAEQSEIDIAISEIIGEMIAQEYVVKIITDDLKQNATVKHAIEEAFEELNYLIFVIMVMILPNDGTPNGRLFFHVIIDEQNTKDGTVSITTLACKN